MEELGELGPVDIVVGIPSYNSALTIGHVVKTAQAGLLKHLSGHKALIVNSDGGSKDGTTEIVQEAKGDTQSLIVIKHPLYPVHHLTTPYHGMPGKGNAFRTLFRVAELTEARALVVVDADLRSIKPEWFNLLMQPILAQDFDYVAPYYNRHKYEGTITSSIVYPLTRALYGRRIRQPIGGEFGISGRLARHFLTRDVWNTDVARYSIDIWMTTTAVAGNFRVCQSHLGARVHDSKDPGPDLSAMLVQVVGSVFNLMETFESVWQNVLGSLPAPLLGSPFGEGVQTVPVPVLQLIASFAQGVRDLRPIYETLYTAQQLKELDLCASLPVEKFALREELWVGLIYEAALAYHRREIDREHLLKSLAPLYLGWVASFAGQTENKSAAQSEDRIERLCLIYEQLKPYLINQWPLGAREKR